LNSFFIAYFCSRIAEPSIALLMAGRKVGTTQGAILPRRKGPEQSGYR